MSTVERIMRLFEGFNDAHGTYDPTNTERNLSKNGKLEIKKSARTVREAVTSTMWNKHLTGERPLGIIAVRPDGKCRWGCIDVDRYDISLTSVLANVHRHKFPLIVCRTKSGGAHLFLFFTEFVPVVEVKNVLKEMAAALGFGDCEIFPKQVKLLIDRGDTGNWLNMPYFGGDTTDRYAVKRGGLGMTTEEFLDLSESMRLSPRDLVDFRVIKPEPEEEKQKENLDEGPPCLQYLSKDGFPDGTRNAGLFALGVFCKKKFGEDWAKVLEKFNQKFMKPPLDSGEVQEIIKRLEKREYNYTCKNEPLYSHCNSTLCRQRKFGIGGGGEYPEISGLAVLDTDPPIWFVNVEGHRLELATDELQDYKRFQKRCMERLHIIYKTLKQETWLSQLAPHMETITKIEVSDEVGAVGQFLELLEDFVTDKHRADSRDDLLLGRPWEDEEKGRFYFRLRDLMAFFRRERFDEMSRGQVINRLRDIGGDKEFTTIKKQGVNMWWIPNNFTKLEPRDLPPSRKDPI